MEKEEKSLIALLEKLTNTVNRMKAKDEKYQLLFELVIDHNGIACPQFSSKYRVLRESILSSASLSRKNFDTVVGRFFCYADGQTERKQETPPWWPPTRRDNAMEVGMQMLRYEMKRLEDMEAKTANGLTGLVVALVEIADRQHGEQEVLRKTIERLEKEAGVAREENENLAKDIDDYTSKLPEMTCWDTFQAHYQANLVQFGQQSAEVEKLRHDTTRLQEEVVELKGKTTHLEQIEAMGLSEMQLILDSQPICQCQEDSHAMETDQLKTAHRDEVQVMEKKKQILSQQSVGFLDEEFQVMCRDIDVEGMREQDAREEFKVYKQALQREYRDITRRISGKSEEGIQESSYKDPVNIMRDIEYQHERAMREKDEEASFYKVLLQQVFHSGRVEDGSYDDAGAPIVHIRCRVTEDEDVTTSNSSMDGSEMMSVGGNTDGPSETGAVTQRGAFGAIRYLGSMVKTGLLALF